LCALHSSLFLLSQVYPSCADVGLGFFADPDTAAAKLTPFMSGEPYPDSAAPSHSVPCKDSTGTLDAMQHSGSLTSFPSQQSIPITKSASGALTPAAVPSPRASAPLPSGLDSLAANASMLPPKTQRPGAPGTLPSGGGSGFGSGNQGQNQQGKKLGFRFRLWGGGGGRGPRGSSADGTPLSVMPVSSTAASLAPETLVGADLSSQSPAMISDPSADVGAGLNGRHAKVGCGDSITAGSEGCCLDNTLTGLSLAPRKSVKVVSERASEDPSCAPSLVPDVLENPSFQGSQEAAEPNASHVSLEEFVTPLSVAEDP